MFRAKQSLFLIFIISMAFALILPLSLQAVTNIVPDSYAIIQGAIDNAFTSGGGIVVVKPGWYGENLTLRSGVSVLGAGWSNTFLYGGRKGNVVYAEDADQAQIDGFAIYGSSTDPNYAGVRISGGSIIVSNNLIALNANGIYITGGSTSIIKNNLMYLNGSGAGTYGLICLDSKPMITNNQINKNYGGGVYLNNSSNANFINNTVTKNGSEGIWCDQSASVIKNSIFTENSIGIRVSNGVQPQISYNCVYNNTSMDYSPPPSSKPGDISEDPLLLGSIYKGFYLDSNSPCIDAGDPNPIYNDVGGSRNDMGATGGECGVHGSTDVSEINSGFMFTSIGKIPVSEITSEGLADVSSEVANDLHIHEYSNAPFGGWLWLNGQFGYEDGDVRYYKIEKAAWGDPNVPPDPNDFEPLTDPLTKIKYTIAPDGSVLAERTSIGPLDSDGLYERTNIGYYAHPDLKLILNSRNLPNGKYDFRCRAYDENRNEITSLPVNANSQITMLIDNSPVETRIHEVTYDTNVPIVECEIITLSNANEDLKFKITAWHPNGYLRRYVLIAYYGTNQTLGVIKEDNYDGVGIVWHGVSSETFDSSSLPSWEICAYEFYLYAIARTTDGFQYIYDSGFRDHYYITY